MQTRLLRFLSGAAAIAMVSAGAQAADLPAAQPSLPSAPVFQAAPVFTWSGFYGGINAGWGWRNDDDESVVLTPGPDTPGLAGTLVLPGGDEGGFVGGGQIGYNFQFGSFVVGAEADLQWVDNGGSQSAYFVPAAGFVGTFEPGTFSTNAPDWFGTVRARAGVAFDRVLIYATGGLAYTDDDTGWVVGGGVEWALPTNFNLFGGSNAVTLGIEGLWFNVDRDTQLGSNVGTFTPVGGTPVLVETPGGRDDDDSDFFVARAKLNFKFGTY